MPTTRYTHVLVNGKEIGGVLDLNNSTIQEIKPTYLAENFVLTDNIIKLPENTKFLILEIPKTPIIFLKPNSAPIGHKDNIIYPEMVKRVDYKDELAVVIKKTAKYILPENVDEYNLGYTCFNDVTAREQLDTSKIV